MDSAAVIYGIWAKTVPREGGHKSVPFHIVITEGAASSPHYHKLNKKIWIQFHFTEVIKDIKITM